MKKSNYDGYLKEQLKDFAFKARYNQAVKAFDVALQIFTSYCPQCRIVTNLSESITLRTIPVQNGKTKTLVSKTYHCESCCSFVRSEDESNYKLLIDCK